MNNKYNILDRVYHITPESPLGVILDVMYYFRTDSFSYLITFDHNTQIICIEEELSKDKIFT